MTGRRDALVGIFVGGRSSRMGGSPKGLLAAPGGAGTLVGRLTRVAREALPGSEIVLVGEAAAYERLGLRFLRDDPPGVGPIGGLRALLLEAKRLRRDAYAVACDLPFVTPAVLRRLRSAQPDASTVAPRLASVWQPLCARYDPTSTLVAVDATLAEGRRALHHVLGRLGDAAVVLAGEQDDEAVLRDWDSPEDVNSG